MVSKKRTGKKMLLITAMMLTLIGAGAVKLKWDIVREVIDGDTLVLGNGQKVRLLGTRAPELQYCGGEKAKEILEKLTLGKRIRLTEMKVDPYGRILALVYTSQTLVNEKMLESGYSTWDGTENNLGKRLGAAADTAQKLPAGVYYECRQPDDPKCLIKGNIEKRSGTTTGGKKSYFFKGCSEYEATIVEKELGEQWFCTEAEAWAAGYEKGTNCYGKVYTE